MELVNSVYGMSLLNSLKFVVSLSTEYFYFLINGGMSLISLVFSYC